VIAIHHPFKDATERVQYNYGQDIRTPISSKKKLVEYLIIKLTG
jgi:hypothetical protein